MARAAARAALNESKRQQCSVPVSNNPTLDVLRNATNLLETVVVLRRHDSVMLTDSALTFVHMKRTTQVLRQARTTISTQIIRLKGIAQFN